MIRKKFNYFKNSLMVLFHYYLKFYLILFFYFNHLSKFNAVFLIPIYMEIKHLQMSLLSYYFAQSNESKQEEALILNQIQIITLVLLNCLNIYEYFFQIFVFLIIFPLKKQTFLNLMFIVIQLLLEQELLDLEYFFQLGQEY